RPASGTLLCVEIEIEEQDVDPRLSQDPEVAALGVLRHDGAYGVFGNASSARDAADLIRGGRGRDVRVEPTARRRHEIDRNGQRIVRIRRAKGLDTRLGVLRDRLVRRAEVRSGRGSGVEPARRGRRKAPPEVLRILERLSDEPRAGDAATM